MLWRMLTTRLAPHRVTIAVIVVLQLASTIATLYLPNLNADIIDDGVAKGDTGFILRTGAVMLAISIVQIAASVYAVFLAARTSMAFGRDTRAEVFHRVGDFSAREVAQFGAPTLISRTSNDVQQVQMIVFMGLAMMLSAPIMMVGGVIMALRTDVGLFWLVAVAVPLLALSVGLILRQMLPQFRIMQTSIDSVNRILREQITGIRVVRAFVRERFEERRFAEANATLTGTALTVGRLMAVVFPIVMLILNVSTVAVLWFGAHRVNAGEMQIGDVTAFLAYLMQILMSVMMATMMSMMIPRASVSAERITAVVDTEPSVRPPAKPVATLASPASVVFDGVDFQYPGATHPVLNGISFEARPGETTAIIGSTGAGKTTLVGLVPRLGRRHRRTDARRRGRRARGRPGRPVVADRAGAAEAVPVLRHRRLQPALRQPAGHRRRALGGAADRAGRGLRAGHAGGPGRTDRPGRHQRLRRSAPAPRDRPGARSAPRDLPLRRLLLGARPRDRRPAAGRAAAGHPGGDRPRRRATGLDDRRRRPDRRRSTTGGWSGADGTPSCSRPARPTRRSSCPSALRRR